MKALLSKAVGGPETLVLDEMPSPEAKPGQAVVSVKAVGVNFPDVLIIEDKYQFKPARPFAPGGEVSGIVKAVGEGVTTAKPGDRVRRGQALAIIEAMKMEHTLAAPGDLTVKTAPYRAGDQVNEGAIIVSFEDEG